VKTNCAGRLLALAAAAWPACLPAQTAENVLLVVNQSDSLSKRIGDYYVHRRALPLRNVCRITAPAAEKISDAVYVEQVERPVAQCLKSRGLVEKVLFVATTAGVPLIMEGPGQGPGAETAAVDSELALLYTRIKGGTFPRKGAIPNPYFGRRDAAFAHPRFPIYLVTRLAGYDFADVKGIIDRALAARNRG
jgi:uncharacterized protein (TIGR03790 family)